MTTESDRTQRGEMRGALPGEMPGDMPAEMPSHLPCTLPGAAAKPVAASGIPSALARRGFLQLGAAATGLLGLGLADGPWARLALAASPAGAAKARSGATRDARVVMVLLRGGMDGLFAVPPVGDPDFRNARGPLAEYPQAPLPLNSFFGLHPALSALHAMYGQGEAAVLQAVGLAYSGRSHFDAQQLLESGGSRPYELDTGWLGRALGLQQGRGLAMNTVVPLALRGANNPDTWAPSSMPEPSAELVERLTRLYSADPAMAAALERARALHLDADMAAAMGKGTTATGRAAAGRGAFESLARKAAEFMVAPNGPQAAVLELGGWDSHAGMTNPNGPLVNNLRQLDAGLAALREGLQPGGVWGRTVVVVASEFGREVAVNGTLGSDHGTGGAAFVLGGAVKGGRVIADWPGLAVKQRFEGRDLRTTTDLRSVLAGVLTDHLGVSGAHIKSRVFPGAANLQTVQLLA